MADVSFGDQSAGDARESNSKAVTRKERRMGPGWCGRLLRVSSEAVAGGRLPLALASQFKHAISSVRWSMKRPASWSSSKCVKNAASTAAWLSRSWAFQLLGGHDGEVRVLLTDGSGL